MIGIIIVTHGEFGAYMVEAAEQIVGPQGDGVRCVSISARLGLGEVRTKLSRAIEELSAADGVVIVTDMPGGTPMNVAMPLVKDRPRVGVISGLSLYMLVAAFGARRTSTLEQLTARMLEAGRKAVADVKSAFLAKA